MSHQTQKVIINTIKDCATIVPSPLRPALCAEVIYPVLQDFQTHGDTDIKGVHIIAFVLVRAFDLKKAYIEQQESLMSGKRNKWNESPHSRWWTTWRNLEKSKDFASVIHNRGETYGLITRTDVIEKRLLESKGDSILGRLITGAPYHNEEAHPLDDEIRKQHGDNIDWVLSTGQKYEGHLY